MEYNSGAVFMTVTDYRENAKRGPIIENRYLSILDKK